MFNVAEAEGLGMAAWAELIEQPVPALALWESGSPHFIKTWAGELPSVDEVTALLNARGLSVEAYQLPIN